MRVINWKKQAINDLIKIGQKISLDSPVNAEKMVVLIEDKVTLLITHSEMGRIGPKRGTR